MFDTKNFIKRLIYDVLVFVLLISLVFRFGAGFSGVASGSMEGTILTGDKLVLVPAFYGGKTPQTLFTLPFVQQETVFGFPSYIRIFTLPVLRAPGYKPEIGEVMTFEPTINDTYGTYTEAKKDKKQKKVVWHPDDTKTPFLKRYCAKPGDRVKIEDTQVLLNGATKDPNAKFRQYHYQVCLSDALAINWLNDKAASNVNGWHAPEVDEGQYKYELTMTLAQRKNLENFLKRKGITLHDIKPKPYEGLETTEGDAKFRNDMPELVVPYHCWDPKKKRYNSLTIKLNKDTHKLYIATLQNTDKDFKVEKKGDEIRYYLKGKQIFKYTFKENFFFPIGDNFHDSRDGRSFGFVPFKNLNAKAYRVIFNYQAWKDGKGWRFFHKIPTGNSESGFLLFFIFLCSLLILLGGMWFIMRRFE